ncbi:uncharacterized protein LOC124169199 [Ischnura elegans]|uniref:uncharacterized protein LOC124169199 n=1 Tax=Ischnura elegans TaxID=197161 RepID=UPI001ED89399|nr:uncharacterized protein LOC124169199 [Ischnura elegans]
MPLEGSVEKESEVRAKYVAHPAGRRAELQRKNTNLSLEGEMECKAEYRESYIDFPRHRPCIEKPEGQLLRQDGPLQCDPEYRSSFVDFPRERPLVSKPLGALKLDGETYFNAEYKDRYVDFPRERPRANKPGGDLKIQETEGEFKYTPEYKERYVDFPRERPRCSKPSGDLKPEGDFEEMTSEVRSRYVWLEGADRQPAPKRQESLAAASTQNGESYLMPEYRERYVTFPRERPRRRKPESQIKPPEVTVTPEETEVKAKFTGEAGRRAEMVKRESSLKLEGELIARPEYRDQYVAPPPPAPREHPDVLDDHEVDVHGSPKRTETTASTLRPPDSILPHSDSGGDSTPPKSKSPTRVVPRPIGRRRRSVSASEVKEEIVSPYRAFRVLRSPYIGYEPTVMVKTDIGRRSPSLSPARRRREPKFADTKRKASFVVINEDRLDDMVPTRGRLRPCAASGCSNRGRWMPPWYTVPTVR